MPSPYPLALRERVVRALDRGVTVEEVAERFEIGTATVGRWRRQQRQHGDLAPSPRPPRGSTLDAHGHWLAELRATEPSLPLRLVCERLAEERGVEVHETTLWYWLRRQGIRHKKTR